MAIFMEAPQQRKGRSVDALKKAGEHPAVITAVARLFWNERKVEKARQWFGNAITADQDWGDAWGWWLKFERQHGELVCLISHQGVGGHVMMGGVEVRLGRA
jgi:pre-mRNA-processing factor 6